MKHALLVDRFIPVIFFLILLTAASTAGSQPEPLSGDAHIIDSWHYSKVFGEVRNYRIFLPPEYFKHPEKRYPVIYFFHGWSQRYFGPVGDDYSNYDQGEDNGGDNMANYVEQNEVIIVKVDGFNGEDLQNYSLTPYNIGDVESFRQFPMYFPELVGHIDASYKTLADRNHRAVSGLSMGGFMTFWISGKYPHLVSAAGNFCGSPEFHAGPAKFPVEYRNMDMYNNYGGVNVRMHYGDKDNLRFYHQDMNRVWGEVMENYEYKVFDARHSTCGLGEMFDFILNTFKNPLKVPEKWNHIDLYPEFSLWDYQVSSDRYNPGFTILEEVNKMGFKCMVREFLPDGPAMSYVNLNLTTAPEYKRNTQHVINIVDITNGRNRLDTLFSDESGRLKIGFNGSPHYVGINDLDGSPNIRFASCQIGDDGFAVNGDNVSMSIDVMNIGTIDAEGVTVRLSALKDYITVTKQDSQIDRILPGQIKSLKYPFELEVKKKGVEMAKFKLTTRDKSGYEWIEYFEIPLKDAAEFTSDFVIADGSEYTVARSGIDSVTLFLGKGNGDGQANPGETIVILAKEKGRYWRTEAETTDPYVNPYGIKLRESDNWAGYDYVNGSAKITLPIISSDCPKNHMIDFFINYWVPIDRANHSRDIIKKKVRIPVSGKDTTPPTLLWAHVSGNNTIEARVIDGSKIEQVTAQLIPVHDTKGLDYVELKEPETERVIVLYDNGSHGDRIPGDFVFSYKIPLVSAYFYNLAFEMSDSFGNTQTASYPEVFIIY